MLNISKPTIVNRRKLYSYFDGILDTNIYTNNGPLVQELTARLESYLDVENMLLVANGTLGLQVAYSAMNLSGSIVTTPFSFVATAGSMKWNGIQPIFADVDPRTLNLCPTAVGRCIQDDTSAIVPVHVFGNPVDLDEFDRLSHLHDVKLVYDAAHAFGVKYKGESILGRGDASVLSFHATKLFHTGEGGAVVFRDKQDLERARSLINFGMTDGEVCHVGINAKMSEFHAAIGLAVLDQIDNVIERHLAVYDKYYNALNDYVVFIVPTEAVSWTAPYVSILLSSESERDKVFNGLVEQGINPKKYFSPSLDSLSVFDGKGGSDSVALSERVLCIPSYYELSDYDVENIINAIMKLVGRCE